LSVTYGGFRALDAVDLVVPEGEIRGLIGPNGAGKSTCFNAICGYVRPSGGAVSVYGSRLRPNSPHAAWKAGIGRTFQRVELFWTLSIRDHVEMARRQATRRRLSTPSTEEVTRWLGLAGREDELVANLPMGTCRLVELARAIGTGSRLVLLDEPCSGLDRHETTELKVAMTRIQSELGLSCLIVEHDMDFILSIASHVFVLASGRLIAEGTPEEIRASQAVREAYLGGDSNDVQDPRHATSGTA
jgi:ABC-type branched-subunit amino acid transport system ATPase component